MIYKEKLGTIVGKLAVESGIRSLFGGNKDFAVTYVDKQKTGVRVKLDFVDSTTVNDVTFECWEKKLKEMFGDLVVRVQRDKHTFTHDGAGRYLCGNVGTTVRVRFKEEVRFSC